MTKAKSKKVPKDDFQERKVRVEEKIKQILNKEGLGIQAVIQRTDMASVAAVIFIDVRAIEAEQANEKETK